MMDGSALDLVTAMGMMNNARDNRSYDDGFGFGGGGIWLLVILFFIMFAGNWGENGWGNNCSGAANQLTNEFLYTNLNNTMQRGIDQLTCQNFGLQKDMCQGFAGVQASLAENRFAQEKCCCETKQEIMQNRFENQKNTCDIITSMNAGTQRILDAMKDEKIDSLRTELQSAQLSLQNNAQTQTLINTLLPRSTPSYLSCSPYQSNNFLELLLLSNLRNGCGCNSGCNSGCGWNGNCNGFNYNFG